MRRRAGWVVGAVVAVAAGGIALTIGQERRLPADFQRGITFTGYGPGEYGRPDAVDALEEAAELGVEWVAITPAWYQTDVRSADIRRHPARTPADASVEAIIEEARDLRIEVMLKPHLNPRDGTFRGEISPRDVDRWFVAYARMLGFYADMAERTDVSQLAIGTELEGVSGRTQRWRELIKGVRERFGGKLTYAANYDEVLRIDFWDALDFIGVDAYYPLRAGPDPSVSDIVAAWRKPVRALERVHERWGKKVLLTEIGYPSAESALRTPYEGVGDEDQELQARAIEAALAVWAEPPWAAGMYLWEWSSAPAGVTEGDRGLALNGKPAADVIEEWYSD